MTLPSFPSTGKSKAEVLAIMCAAPDQMCKGKRSALSVWCAKAAAVGNLLQRHKFRAEIDRRVVALRRCRNGLVLSIDQGKARPNPLHAGEEGGTGNCQGGGIELFPFPILIQNLINPVYLLTVLLGTRSGRPKFGFSIHPLFSGDISFHTTNGR